MVLQSPIPEIVIPRLSFAKHLLQKISKFGDKIALVDDSSGCSYSFSEFCDLSKKCAAALYKLGVRRGDVVAVCCSNSVEYLTVILGVQLCGATATTCNPLYTKDEITNQFAFSEPKVVFIETQNYAKIKEVASSVKSIKIILAIDECKECKTVYQLIKDVSAENFPSHVDSHPDDVILLLHSSGTTGLPKGVMHTNSTFLSMFFIARIAMRYSPTDVAYLVVPFFHIYGVFKSLMLLEQGAKVVLQKRFHIEHCLRAIQQHQITTLLAVPPMIVAIDKSPLIFQYDLSSVKSIFTGAAPLPEGVVASLSKKLNFVLVQAWGLTEGVPLTTTIDKSYPLRSVGTVCPNTLLKVLDINTGEELPAGKDGELCAKGPQIMKGYFKNPAATAICIDSEGWLHTGDVGHYDSDGFVYIVDRIKELIKYKGFQIAPAELEDVLLRHPKVTDAGVIGISDSEAGEVPKAFVVKKDSSLSEAELHAFMREKVTKYKQLNGGIVFVSSIPKTASGKILRRDLRKL